ncbi:MAG: ANTAR domain-containing protein [Clostridia bacterium]|nr:ANTAR domain-containing protein [Clostridia bacterium]
MNNNIFIAFDNPKTAVSIARILISNGNNVVSIAKSTSELIHSLDYYPSGIIITGCTFDGIRMEEVIRDISEDFNIIVLGKRVQLDSFNDERAFKLSLPLQKNDLICSVEMLMTMDTPYKPAVHKNQNNERTILRAKHLLIDMYSMSEEQAHRYMQKKSMDTGRKLIDIAKIILEV